MMPDAKKKRLARKGWVEGDYGDFLGLSEEERAFVEMKSLLASEFRRVRESLHLTQDEVAKVLGSGQSRVAKMEAGDPSVSLDLLIRGLIALGKTRKEVGRLLAA